MKTVKSEEIIQRFYDENVLGAWNALDREDLDKAIELAKSSLQEAKAQTEYQDQKAMRLLTVSTFLTAVAGASFANFSSNHPLNTLSQQSSFHWWPLVLTYLAFFLFVLFSLAGALVTFHATRTRFKYPVPSVDRQSRQTRSYLFFKEIIGVTPEGWAGSFVTVSDSGGKRTAKLNPNLRIEYLKNYVSEAYLIAAKTADKLRFLEPAQSLLSLAQIFLMIYVIIFAFVSTYLPPQMLATQPIDARVFAVPTQDNVPVQKLPQSVTVSQPVFEARR